MSTLSNVTDGQLSDDGDVPAGAPSVVTQSNEPRSVMASTAAIVSTQSNAAVVVVQQQNVRIVVNDSPIN